MNIEHKIAEFAKREKKETEKSKEKEKLLFHIKGSLTVKHSGLILLL